MIGSLTVTPHELADTGRLTEPVGSDGRLIGCDCDGLGWVGVGLLLGVGPTTGPTWCDRPLAVP